MSWLDRVVASGRVPDPLLRLGIRRLLRARLRAEDGDPSVLASRRSALITDLRSSPIALATDQANEQHYEVPTAFFEAVLGHRLKYSGALWSDGVTSLDEAEDAMLDCYLKRAELADGQSILELGCGWGSLTLTMAQRLPSAKITAVSNSATQRATIEAACADRGLSNVTVVTRDMNVFETDAATFDRVVSIEMFEHMRNYEKLFANIHRWLRPGGKLFVHIFCHRTLAYPFESRGAGDWMARHFFTGGLMPSSDLLPVFQGALRHEKTWLVDGTHYQKTAEAWLANLDRDRATTDPILAATYGDHQLDRWRAYWRVFFLACAELFGFRRGQEWMVVHHRWVSPT